MQTLFALVEHIKGMYRKDLKSNCMCRNDFNSASLLEKRWNISKKSTSSEALRITMI